MIKITEYVKTNAELLLGTGKFGECKTFLIHLSLMPVYMEKTYISEWEDMFILGRSDDTDHLYGIKAVDMLFEIARCNLYCAFDADATRELMKEYEDFKTKMKMIPTQIGSSEPIEW